MINVPVVMESVLKISGKKYLLGVMDASLLGFITRKYLFIKLKSQKNIRTLILSYLIKFLQKSHYEGI
jgi:hypothetical protein